jgi:hypothetical protein
LRFLVCTQQHGVGTYSPRDYRQTPGDLWETLQAVL